MARINTSQLINHANHIGGIIDMSDRAYQVQQDPAVRKAWRECRSDVTRAGKSLAMAAMETRAAWCRTSPNGGNEFTSLYA